MERTLGIFCSTDSIGNNMSGKQIQNDADVVILAVESVIGYIAAPDFVRLLRIKQSFDMIIIRGLCHRNEKDCADTLRSFFF